MNDDSPEPALPAAPAPAAPAPAALALEAELPQPRVEKRRRWSVSLVWLLPAIAIAVAGSLLVRTVFLSGPRIEIEFASADGVEAGKTEVRYKEVVIGKVTTVSLRDDAKRVVVSVQLNRSASGFAVADTSFWVVRPRVGVSGVSGLGTLLSGAYIAADAGVSNDTRKDFVGLETPPLVLRGEPGVIYVLHADDLGSLDVGSPVFHRRTRVGRVVGYILDANLDAIFMKIFVDAPYQKLVTTNTRFWNASGIDLTLNASGLTVNTQTLASVLAGGLAFEVPSGAPKGPPAPENSAFTLFSDKHSALAPPDGTPVPVRLVFEQTVRGLTAGADIDLLGIDIGQVRSIAPQYDAQHKRFPIEVIADVFPLRLGAVRAALLRDLPENARTDAAVMQKLIGSGLQAQLRTGNLLTGQLYVAFDFFPKPARVVPMAADGTLNMPTTAGTLNDVQPQIAEIVQKVSKIPFDEIGHDLRDTLRQANKAISQLSPDAQKALAEVQKTLAKAQATLDSLDRNLADPNAPIQRNAAETLLELQRTSQSLRVLSDYLQQHPESILRGKPADPPAPQR